MIITGFFWCFVVLFFFLSMGSLTCVFLCVPLLQVVSLPISFSH